MSKHNQDLVAVGVDHSRLQNLLGTSTGQSELSGSERRSHRVDKSAKRLFIGADGNFGIGYMS